MTVVVKNLDSRKYGRLLARVLPVVIQTEQEYDRIDAEIGRLLKKGHRNLSPEERALLELMTKLIEDYDDQHYSFPKSQPHELLRALMEQNGLSAADLQVARLHQRSVERQALHQQTNRQIAGRPLLGIGGIIHLVSADQRLPICAAINRHFPALSL